MIIYQRVASGPFSAMVLNGSIVFPLLLDILIPFLSKTRPFETTFLYAILSKTKVPIACKV
ncbi:hypothetical protein D3C72_968440 [compost metagenome]